MASISLNPSFDPKAFYQKMRQDLFNEYKIDIPKNPPYDPIMLEIYVAGKLLDEYATIMSQIFETSKEHFDDLSNKWVEREDESWKSTQQKINEILKANEQSLKSTFVATMRTAISEGVNNITEDKVKELLSQNLGDNTKKLKFSNTLMFAMCSLLTLNLIVTLLRAFNIL